MNFRTMLSHINLYKGVSYSPMYGNLAGKEGFAVSPYKERERVQDTLNEDDLRKYFVNNLDLLSENNHFMGVWVDDGKYYLDVSIFETSEDKAKEIARNAEQLAIFNLSNLETVYL